MPAAKGPSRDEKLENLIVNHSLIFVGMFEEAFADIAEKMTEAIGAGMAAAAGALASSETHAAARVGKKMKKVTPEVRAEIEQAFSGMHEEMAAQWPKNPKTFKQYISGPKFDKGIAIVEKYDFKRPKLTEKLSDEELASYIFLVKSGNAEIGKMFKELADWQSGLPTPPWRGEGH